MFENVLFVCNGPGEIHSLLRPLAQAFKKKSPHIRLHLLLTPSQFASGYEESMARDLNLFESIHSVNQFWNYVKKPALLKKSLKGSGLVFAIAGDLWHTRLINRALRWPQYAYLEVKQWGIGFKQVFYANQENLMADLPRVPDAQFQKALQSKRMGFYVGSRQAFMRRLVPFYRELILKLKLVDSIIQPEFWVPEHLQPEFKKEFPQESLVQTVEEVALMITIVGTNTAVLSAKQVPMIVWLPLNWPEAVPVGGLLNFSWLKKIFLAWVVRRQNKKWALPNQLSGKNLVPELVEVLSPAQMAEKVLKLWKTPSELQSMHQSLENILGQPGVAQRMVQQIWN